MTSTKGLVERLQHITEVSGVEDGIVNAVCDALIWIERWGPVVEKARAVAEEWERVNSKHDPAGVNATKLCERLDALSTALGEDRR